MTSEKSDTGNASGAAPETPKSKPSDKQMNLLAIIMQNIEDQPKINWENVATQASLKNDRVAKEMYRQMCKKFGWGKPTTTPGGACDTPSKASRVTKSTGKVGSARKPRGKKAAIAAAAAAEASAAATADDDGDKKEDVSDDGLFKVEKENGDAADLFMEGDL